MNGINRSFSFVFLVLVISCNSKKQGPQYQVAQLQTIDYTTIDGFAISDGENTVVLKKQNGKWLLNDSLKARNNVWQLISGSLMRVQLKVPASDEQLNEIYGSRSTVKTLKLYSSNKEVIKLQVASTSDGKGFLCNVKEKQAFQFHFPGYIGHGVLAFLPVDEQFWKEKSLFEWSRTDLKELSVTYANKPKNSFVIHLYDDSLRVNDISVEKDIVEKYLSYYHNINVQTLENYELKHDTVLFCQINTGLGIDKLNTHRFYNLVHGNEQHTLSDTMLVLSNGVEHQMFVNFADVALLFKTPEYFVK